MYIEFNKVKLVKLFFIVLGIYVVQLMEILVIFIMYESLYKIIVIHKTILWAIKHSKQNMTRYFSKSQAMLVSRRPQARSIVLYE